MNLQTPARTSLTSVPEITRVAAARRVAPVYQPRVPYARALYAAAVAALLAACTPPERAPAPDAPPERVGTVAATVESAVAGEELPVIVVRASRELPVVVITASRGRPESVS